MHTVQLLTGTYLPVPGLGTFQNTNGNDLENAVRHALDVGYRHIDTVAIHDNEQRVGKAIAASGIPREDIFITTKLGRSDQQSGDIEGALEESLKRLDMDYVDLYLTRWPGEDSCLEIWKKMQLLHHDGKARAIGVSNFLQEQLEILLPEIEVVPAVNQVDHNPYSQKRTLRTFCQQREITFEASAPLMQGRFVQEPLFAALAKEYNKTPAQILLRWHLEHRVALVPTSVNEKHITENAQIFDFDLSEADIAAIDHLDRDHRIEPNPPDCEV